MSEQASTVGHHRARRHWLALVGWAQQSALAPSRPTTGELIAVVLCTSYQTLLVVRLLLAGTVLDGSAYAFTRDWYGALVTVCLTIGAAVLLTGRSRRPLAVLAVECLLFAAASAVGMSNYLLFPLLFALFSCVSRPPASAVLTGLVSVWTVMTFSALVSRDPSGVTVEYLSLILTACVTVAAAIAARSVRGWRRSRRQALAEELRSQLLTQQRDRAVSRTRVAAELHDSVGHGLTTIIALAEGLAGTTGDAQVDEAIAGINTVARSTLEETRRVVRALAETGESVEGDDGDERVHDPSPGVGAREDSVSSLHEWADILPVLGRVRALGVSVVLIETGRRPGNAQQADLCFAVTREAVTNAIRHTAGLRSLTVAWDHEAGRATTVTVRSVGAPRAQAAGPSGSAPGTGLRRLRLSVEDTGGTLTYGWQDDAWVVRALVNGTGAAGQADVAGARP